MSPPRESTSAFLKRHPVGHTEFLIGRAAGGSEKAWNALLERYHRRLRLEVRLRIPARLRRYFDEDDVLAQAFHRAYQHRGKFRDQGEPAFRRWLTVLVARELLSMMRARHLEQWKRASGTHLEGLEGHAAPGSHEATLDDQELYLQAIRKLRPGERDLISMYHFEGMTFECMATLLGVSRQEASRRYWQAYGRLENWLRKLRGDDDDGDE